MTEVRVERVDERDSTWEDPRPRFRVYLHGSGETTISGWTDTYDVVGADLLQVVEWAQRQAGDSLTYAIALVCTDHELERHEPGRGRGLVWLVGMDGNDQAGEEHAVDTQRRMLARRREPVGIPAADAMPPGVADPYDDGSESRQVAPTHGRGTHQARIRGRSGPDLW